MRSNAMVAHRGSTAYRGNQSCLAARVLPSSFRRVGGNSKANMVLNIKLL